MRNVGKLLILLFLGLQIAICGNDQETKKDSIKNILENSNLKDTAKINLLNKFVLMQIRDNNQKIPSSLLQAIKLSKKIGYPKGEAESYRVLGYHFYKLSNYDSSFAYYQKSLDLFISINDTNGIAKVNMVLGLNFLTRCDYQKAIEALLKAQKLFKKLSDNINISKTLLNLGMVYFYLQDYDNALNYYNEAMLIQEKNGNILLKATCLNNIADIYTIKHQYNKAINFQQEALRIVEQLEIKSLIAFANLNLAISFFEQGKLNMATNYFNKALSLSDSNANAEVKCESLIGLAKLYYKVNNYRRAEKYGNQGLDLAIKINNTERMSRAYEIDSKIYAALGNYKKAYELYNNFKRTSDSTFSKQNIKKIADLESRFKFDKEKQEIEQEHKLHKALFEEKIASQNILRNFLIVTLLLVVIIAYMVYRRYSEKRKVNKILIERFNEIKDLNATKDKIFAIISHDLRNPVGNIRSFSEVIETDKDSLDKKEILDFVKIIRKQSNSVLNTLENLMSWVNSQKKEISINLESQRLIDAINNNISLLEEMANQKEIRIVNKIEPDIYATFDLNMITSVIRNLIANAIKFTHKKGTISIDATKKESGYILSVTDTGVGMSPDVIKKIFDQSDQVTTNGTENEKGSGLGLQICKEFIKKHGEEFWIESTVGQGSSFKFTLAG